MPDETLQRIANDGFDTVNNRHKIDVETSVLPTGAATDANLVSGIQQLLTVLGEVQVTPTANTVLDRLKDIDSKDFATQTTLAAVLAKIIAAPATEAKQDTLIAKDFATQTTLASVNSYVSRIGEVQETPTVYTQLRRLKDIYTAVTGLLTGIVLAAGSAIIGKVGIDQTTPGTTNNVTAEGKAAHDAAASGNPVQVGGVYRATDPAVADGDAVSLRMNAKGEPLVQLAGSVMEYNETINVPASSFALGTSRNASKHKNILIAVRADATHTWSGSINYQNYNDENIATDVVISSASQVKGASAFVAVKTTNINVLITNSDGASAHNYNTTARLSAE